MRDLVAILFLQQLFAAVPVEESLLPVCWMVSTQQAMANNAQELTAVSLIPWSLSYRYLSFSPLFLAPLSLSHCSLSRNDLLRGVEKSLLTVVQIS